MPFLEKMAASGKRPSWKHGGDKVFTEGVRGIHCRKLLMIHENFYRLLKGSGFFVYVNQNLTWPRCSYCMVCIHTYYNRNQPFMSVNLPIPGWYGDWRTNLETLRPLRIDFAHHVNGFCPPHGFTNCVKSIIPGGKSVLFAPKTPGFPIFPRDFNKLPIHRLKWPTFWRGVLGGDFWSSAFSVKLQASYKTSLWRSLFSMNPRLEANKFWEVFELSGLVLWNRKVVCWVMGR